ncbi:MAG: hypothetical protein HRU36_01270 [Rickettsiales bacterium]|nr:hypothetical protein [Rickettsiales bacterium]
MSLDQYIQEFLLANHMLEVAQNNYDGVVQHYGGLIDVAIYNIDVEYNNYIYASQYHSHIAWYNFIQAQDIYSVIYWEALQAYSVINAELTEAQNRYNDAWLAYEDAYEDLMRSPTTHYIPLPTLFEEISNDNDTDSHSELLGICQCELV